MTGGAFFDGRVVLHAGDCLEVLRTLPADSVHAVVTDPPYHLGSIVRRFGGAEAKAPIAGATGVYARSARGFMGQTWDGGDVAFRPELWREVLRVLTPGGHLIAFGGTRTYHRLASAIEDAGFDIRDLILDLVASDAAVAAFVASLNEAQRGAFLRCLDESGFGGLLAWVFGSGFPKSHDVAKGIDRAAGVAGETRAIPGADQNGTGSWLKDDGRLFQPGAYRPASDAARAWEGWGTALKPALEPICLARKPLSEDTVAANVLRWGTGALNVDACRIDAETSRRTSTGGMGRKASPVYGAFSRTDIEQRQTESGRFPANLCHDGSPEVLAHFPKAGGGFGKRGAGGQNGILSPIGGTMETVGYGDSGSAARFFYSAKADSDDRLGSKHPTVKPVDLMRWLVRLVTPPGGIVLDPFAGTGTTGEAAWREGFSAILIEREAPYRADIARRMALCVAGRGERAREAAKARHGDLAPGPLFGGV